MYNIFNIKEQMSTRFAFLGEIDCHSGKYTEGRQPDSPQENSKKHYFYFCLQTGNIFCVCFISTLTECHYLAELQTLTGWIKAHALLTTSQPISLALSLCISKSLDSKGIKVLS